MPLIPAFFVRRQRWADLCEFDLNMVDIENSRTVSHSYTVRRDFARHFISLLQITFALPLWGRICTPAGQLIKYTLLMVCWLWANLKANHPPTDWGDAGLGALGACKPFPGYTEQRWQRKSAVWEKGNQMARGQEWLWLTDYLCFPYLYTVMAEDEEEDSLGCPSTELSDCQLSD